MGKRLDICSQMPKVSSRNNPCEDRISCLPDEILYFIQSFLDYKEVAQMSILSRRWLSLWMHAPVLNFGAPILLDLHIRVPVVLDHGRNQKRECAKIVSSAKHRPDGRKQEQECDESVFRMMNHVPPDKRNPKLECDKIVNWMSRVSRMHKDENLNEHTVSYTLYRCFKKKGIYSWWENILAREVESLELNFSSIDGYPADCQDSSYVFPDRLLSYCSDCSSWTLSSNVFGSHFLESSGLKSLKSLSLRSILISQKSIHFFLLNCPFLERLEVVDSPILVDLEIKGESLALKYLKIEGCDNLIGLCICWCNIVSLKISALVELIILGLPIIELSIDGTSEKFRCAFSQTSPHHPQLEALTLSTKKPKAIAELAPGPKRLKKLKRLVINVNASGDKSLIGLISFFNACPVLEEFVLTLNWTKPRRSSRMLERAERRRLKHLKVVEFLGYYGRVSDVELIVHLMENAKNLEKVIIDPRNPRHIKHHDEEEAEARSLALQQLKEYVPPLVQLIIR